MQNENLPKEEGNLKYYLFVGISTIIGFITLKVFTKIFLKVLVEKNIIDFTFDIDFISWIVALVGALIFVLLSLLFKSFFKSIYLSEIFLYLYIGALTSAVNIISFSNFIKIFANKGTSDSLGWKIAEILAFVIAVIFAFITNKLFVFKSASLEIKVLAKEASSFFIVRCTTELLNFLMMWFFIDKRGFNSIAVKIIVSIIVILLNYIFSKFIIFKGTSNK